ncbi:DUF5317 family protein [Caldisericum exile]|uniref:Hypothetical membrane protein n=1 Tax=Caldisericum exile (strain DSM 21853 / NBRC 104410 / AZM16c01) TaxID=511051 RepID=A0A7U6JH67_CALEA|nr:DUF5317 family protein [Caldisericum exile]BAL81532.1 hypothetical membrane protein [Caldisericum exile AZM16c01]
MTVFVLVAAILGIIINRGFEGVVENSIRGFYLAIIGFIIQLGIFSSDFAFSEYEYLTPYFYIASLVFLLAFVLLNLNYHGMKIILVGFLLNFLAIITNGGYMPQYIDKLTIAGEFEKIELLKQYGHFYNGILGNSQTRLRPLTDIIAIGKPAILSGVYSIGDLIIIVGLIIFIFEFTKKKKGRSG